MRVQLKVLRNRTINLGNSSLYVQIFRQKSAFLMIYECFDNDAELNYDV